MILTSIQVQTSAVRAVNEVKQNALHEIARLRQELMVPRRVGAPRDKDRDTAGLLRISTSQTESAPEVRQ